MHTIWRQWVRWLAVITLVVVVVGSVGMGVPPATEARGGIWTVNVFNGQNPTGSPVWVGSTGQVNFNWGAGAPIINGVTTTSQVDNFSIAFQASIYFTAGTYTFSATVDDGVRVSVDGVPVLAGWQALGQHTVQSSYTIGTTGNHTVRVEMFEATGNAMIQFNWALSGGGGGGTCVEGYGQYSACPYGSSPGNQAAPAGWPASSGPTAICADGWNSCSTNASTTCSAHGGVLYWCTGSGTTPGSGVLWYAEFFPNLDLTGSPVFTNSYPATGLNENWGENSPGGSVPVDNWSARFTRTLNVPGDLPEGMYTFYAKADDNFRFTIDQTVIFEKWDTFGADELMSAEVAMLSGPHTLKMEYRERELGAYVFLTWTPPNAQNPVITVDGQAVPGTPGAGGGGTPTGVTLNATVNIPTLNVRSGPGTVNPVIAKVNAGAVYTAFGRSADNGWVQILLDPSTAGWVSAQYVTLSGDINTLPIGQAAAAAAPPAVPIGVRARVLGNLRIRQGPSTRTPKIGLMVWGTEVDVIGRSFGNVWYMVMHEGVVGWSYSPYMRIISGSLDAVPYADGTNPVVAPPAPTAGVIVQAFGNMRIRSGPGFNYPQINKIAWGTRVQVLARDATGLWYKIQYGPVVGWSYAAWYRVMQGDVASVPVAAQ